MVDRDFLLEQQVAALNATNIVAITDTAGRITFVNDEFCRISAYSREELLGQDHRILNSKLHPKEFFQDLWRTIQSGKIWRGRIRNKKKTGQYYWVDTAIVPFRDSTGKITEFVSIRKDITDQVRQMSELEEARLRAMDASNAKSSFLASVSHEMRTPLNGILGMTALLRGMVKDQKMVEYVDTIHQSGEMLLTLINDLLDLAKIEAGKMVFEARNFSVLSILDEVMMVLRPVASEKGLEMMVEVGPDLPAALKGDATRIRQILLNLVGNALKFTEQGFVKIRLRKVLGPDKKERVRFEVQDTGIGLSDEVRPQLFGEFVQADSSSTRQHTGTGLGLAISRRLVQGLGGRIGVDSELGKGSLFWFELPLHLADGPILNGKGAARAAPQFSRAGKILLAEDNEINQRVAREMLIRLGHKVVIASDGLLACELASRENFDLILMDCQMPVLDGLEATRRIRKLKPDIPIIAMTANAMAAAREQCREAGMNDFLSKPFEPDKLRQLIYHWLGAGDEVPMNDSRHSSSKSLNLIELLEDPDLVIELIKIFQNQTPLRMEALKVAIEAGRPADAGRVVHNLKSGCSTLRLMSMAKICQEMEDLCRGDRTEPLKEPFLRLQAELHKAMTMLTAEKILAEKAKS